MTPAPKTQLFNKALVFTDLHIGNKANSVEFNDDCLAFVRWAVDEGKQFGADTFIFCGDWHHFRNTLNIQSLDYTLKCLGLLNEAFAQCFIIAGNHDLYFRDNRRVVSTQFSELFPNITLVNDPLHVGDVSLLPWLVGDEWKAVPNLTSKYIFGHFELPSFFMNGKFEMPDHGGLNRTHFINQDYVFSGHFHQRQQHENIVYIGNCFPHNFSDDGDLDRGVLLLEWGGEPAYKAWPEQPCYISVGLSELLEDPVAFTPTPKTNLRVLVDVEADYETLAFIKDLIQTGLKPKTVVYQMPKTSVAVEEVTHVFETVEQILYDQLERIDSSVYSKELLADIYRSL